MAKKSQKKVSTKPTQKVETAQKAESVEKVEDANEEDEQEEEQDTEQAQDTEQVVEQESKSEGRRYVDVPLTELLRQQKKIRNNVEE